DKFQRTRQVKNEMLKAAIKFNLKPKNGINYLISKGLIAKEPLSEQVKDICNFLRTTTSLDKTNIGDYLGDDSEVNNAVRYYWIDSCDF
ncbi:Cytohesin 2, partial [mine drainage metagenome]